ncbi:hypothetical protein [Lacticaseibacillus rhamnosus]|nr:hypothetical protein [Lacticaseibacillus rhamnosus]
MSDVKTLREKRVVGILPAFILAYSILIRFRISLLTQEEEVNLGTKDSKAKEYLSDNTRFSEICNYVLFDGEKVIKPENLKECDTTEVLSVFGIDRKQIVKQKWRDLLKRVSVKHTGQMYVILIGAEAQTDIHYAMPVKTMIYDALNYGEQVNEAKKRHRKNKDYRSSDEFLSGFTLDDKLTPVITITLYLGTTQWDGPRSLAEMMPQMDERILPFINDYRINLLNPLEITDFSKFETGLRPLFELLKNASDEEKLNDLITKDETFTRVDVETVAAINLFVGTDIKYDEKEEVVNMCKAWDDHKKRGIQEGIQQGMQQGIQQGIQQGMQQGRCLEVYSLVQDGILEPEVGAKRVSMSLDDFADAMQKAGYKIPELV